MILAPRAPVRLLGIVDWEMATLGDPLADLGYLTAHLAQRDHPGNVMTELQPVTREPGFPDWTLMAERYRVTSTTRGLPRWPGSTQLADQALQTALKG
jgi:aminoglycoside phosphotransferase (APT) family kinase protein